MKNNTFYSQCGQDEWLNIFFNNKTDGVFVEIGGYDGVYLSNSLFFENLGWTGICIEPAPHNFSKMRESRECICENVAISNYTGTAEFTDIVGYPATLSGLSDKFCEQHIHRINSEISQHIGSSQTKITVNVDTLNNVLDKHDIRVVDFCTVDTEGGEFEILNCIDFDRFEIKVIVVENNYGQTDIQEFMENNKYSLVTKLAHDDVYVLNSLL